METDPPRSTPKISIIIPAYNTASLIATCLDSVFRQTFRGFETIVVNDGSPDTAELELSIQPYRDKIVYIVQENKRAAGARNTAIRRARGEFLAFLDSDDSWFPYHLAEQMRAFENDFSIDMAYADALLISEQPPQRTFMQVCPSEGEATFEALVVERCQIPISTVVVRKSAVVKAGLFDENLPRCDDYDMWLRTVFFGAKVAYSRTPHARLYQGRPDSLGLSRAKMSEADLRILEKLAQNLPLSEAQRALVHQRAADTKARYLVEQGKTQLREGNPERVREMFAEANAHLHDFKLGVVVHSMEFAPSLTNRMIRWWQRLRSA